jgi:PKD repeat protein
MQLANDNKIYFPMGTTNQLGIINNPNNLGAAMNLSVNALSVATKTVKLGVPNFVNHYNPKLNALPFTNTITCSSVSFAPSVQPSQTISGTCANIAYPTTNYFWNFGDPASGVTNTSTLTNPIHNFSATGNFTVNLVMVSQCRIDTITQTVSIVNQNPILALSGPSVICKGEKATFSVTGNYSFFWSNSAVGNSIIVTPTANVVYSVTATNTLNGCKSTSALALTVNKCLKLQNSNDLTNEWLLFPNPVSESLSIVNEAGKEIYITITNSIGQVYYAGKTSNALLIIQTIDWAKGIYHVCINSYDSVLHKQMVIE